jgi:hypothetical protein
MKNRSTILAATLLALACFALLPKVQAATDSPKPGDDVVPLTNTADGDLALASITTGLYNSAFGFYALLSNTDGSFNTGVGAGALLSNVSGQADTAIGTAALLFNNGNFNTALGASAGINNSTGSNNIYIGDGGIPDESNVIAIGNAAASGTQYDALFVGGVVGVAIPTANAAIVYIDTTSGQLGSQLVAADGKKETTPSPRAANSQAMLNREVEQLKKQVEVLTAQLKEQANQIQKVSAQVEMVRPAPKVVGNNR